MYFWKGVFYTEALARRETAYSEINLYKDVKLLITI